MSYYKSKIDFMTNFLITILVFFCMRQCSSTRNKFIQENLKTLQSRKLLPRRSPNPEELVEKIDYLIKRFAFFLA